MFDMDPFGDKKVSRGILPPDGWSKLAPAGKLFSYPSPQNSVLIRFNPLVSSILEVLV